MRTAEQKLARLEAILKKMGRVLIAYSGGVDSTFLVAVAARALKKENVLAVTAVSETYPSFEMKLAKKFARKLGVRHQLIVTSELKNERFRSNPVDRCFFCKDELFNKVTAIAKKESRVVCDATNYSDRRDFRPGRRAAAKWKVASPLQEAGLTKDDIRALSRGLELPTWNMPAQACLASRFPYGTALSAGDLQRIEKAEAHLRKLGLRTFRLRHHGDIARIETDIESISAAATLLREKIIPVLKKLGWRYIALDLEGYRSGSLNPRVKAPV